MFVMLGFKMMDVQTAKAAEAIISAPCEGRAYANGAFVDKGNCALKPGWNARIAVAPYSQVVPDNSYTFIGISHPSLATAHTSIGVVVEALDMVTVPNTPAGRAAVFTVSAGETHRVFVINQSHATINLNNSAFTDTQTHLITTTDALQTGNIKVWSVGTEPNFMSTTQHRPGSDDGTTEGNVQNGGLVRFDNLAQLSMWGVVYQTSNGAGFALEFVGDMQDSSVSGSGIVAEAVGSEAYLGNTSGAGRGVN